METPLLDHLVGGSEQRGGTVNPSAFAVLRFMMNAYFVTSERISPGFAP